MPRTLAQLQAEKAKLDAEITAELERTKNYTPEMHLAEMIHRATCHSNHIDGCAWDYETWNDPTHQRYLRGALPLFNAFPDVKPEVIVNLIIGAVNPR